ncbi:ABC transporter ATP-binding protein [Candidatus Nitrotoga sp. AM1P]|uniref:ABC transporter ATP-binding protein n=1 Tax=Candidatus Nitrotoga sp. AM1P TaxID=2559597 RepID=UPI0010B6EDEE|nr:ABC transporter ATP-binding protein [Candidatus Nitrotoga sp. AM1P]BBJ22713.1 polysaccharide/polyol phosphate ABC transporter ATP-binding protein [Candidatus Nitrotoga sp. AM1P]
MAIIEVNHVTKEYQLGQLQSLKTTLFNQWRRLTGQPVEERTPFKALDDITFSVEQGEVLGIIGHNGAGKSTMLKLLANISKPSSGSIQVKGKIAPLIEVGAGLVGDLTGRENIYLNGAILGIPKSEINIKFDDIVAFAELEEFIDTPIKRYSSGMSVRLGFAIATSVKSDILIVDEVLAVGDLAFQRKCFDRMEDLIRQQGRTVLLVSHNIRQVERMCTRVMLLNHGSILQDGEPHAICDKFYQLSNQTIRDQKAKNSSMRIISSGELKNVEVAVLDSKDNVTDSLTEGSALRIRIRFTLAQTLSNPEFHVGTHTTDFIYLTGESTAVLGQSHEFPAGTHEVKQLIPTYPMVPGTYGIRFAVIDQRGRVVFHGESLKFFTVTAKTMDAPLQDELRLVAIPVQWELQGARYSHA